MARGVKALVVDGAVRDIDSIRDLGFPVFARGTALRAARKAERGCLRLPTSCGGLLVWPGDYLVADDSGIVVLDAGGVETVLAAAQARRDKEATLMDDLRRGRTTMDLLHLTPVLAKLTDDQKG
jgi:4-hydroxy-4-methyl-2-oxoglutarate aldolase